MRALDEFLEAYEAKHGEITEQEMQEAARRARARAVVVRTASERHRGKSQRKTGVA